MPSQSLIFLSRLARMPSFASVKDFVDQTLSQVTTESGMIGYRQTVLRAMCSVPCTAEEFVTMFSRLDGDDQDAMDCLCDIAIVSPEVTDVIVSTLLSRQQLSNPVEWIETMIWCRANHDQIVAFMRTVRPTKISAVLRELHERLDPEKFIRLKTICTTKTSLHPTWSIFANL